MALTAQAQKKRDEEIVDRQVAHSFRVTNSDGERSIHQKGATISITRREARLYRAKLVPIGEEVVEPTKAAEPAKAKA